VTLELLLLIFVTAVGACIGSFLNVVVYRLPAGKSLVRPPSSCPQCGHRLAWYDNVPVLGWIWLGGRCRYCAAPISAQYPIIEAITALLFGGWFYVCYLTDLRPGFAGPGLEPTALIFVAYLVLIGSMLAALLIDARYYVIPLGIPWLATGVAAVLIPAAVFLFPTRAVMDVDVPLWTSSGVRMTSEQRTEGVRPAYRDAAEVRIAIKRGTPGPVQVSAAPLASTRVTAAALAGLVGLGISILLLRAGWIPRSFADEAQYMPAPDSAEAANDPHPWLRYPHPRREMMKECLFLALPVIGFAGAVAMMPAEADWPVWTRALGGVVLGYLAGGAVVWFVRILGTLLFGKEAMGLGDAHLMAAVGAVAGWEVAVLAFFTAPFFGLSWALLSLGAAHLLKQRFRPIPYGPHLAVATVVVMVFREWMVSYFGVLWIR
jgi:leader peptidase (prepilin peptidase) / N-methyltransferase